MTEAKADIINRLKQEILSLQGFKTGAENTVNDIGLGAISHAFPGNNFPLAAVHEFVYAGAGEAAVTGGFLAGMLGYLMKNGGVVIWISASRIVFPPALQSFGVAPDRVIFIDLEKPKEILWVMEEALQCSGLAAVVGEIRELSFNESRRLQLLVENSKVTGFVLRNNPRSFNTTACVTRWKISSLRSEFAGKMPGVGFPRWNVELLKVRNGKPDSWQVEFSGMRFRTINNMIVVKKGIQKDIQKKAS